MTTPTEQELIVQRAELISQEATRLAGDFTSSLSVEARLKLLDIAHRADLLIISMK